MAGLKAKVISKGQITIPIEVRKALKAHTGDMLMFELKEDGIFLKKQINPKRLKSALPATI